MDAWHAGRCRDDGAQRTHASVSTIHPDGYDRCPGSPRSGQRFPENKTFADFITGKPLAGCGWPLDKIEKLIKDDPEVLTLWRQAVTAPAHIHRGDLGGSDNITIRPERGTSRAYTLDRLSLEAPDLYQAVCRGGNL